MPASSTPATRDRVVVTLVHGTWARGRRGAQRWFDGNSQFVQELRRAFAGIDLIVGALTWSGKNSVQARHDASVELARIVSLNLERFPGDQHLIIAHSHGGNIALKALDIIGTKARGVLLVTVATPFLKIYRNSLSIRYRIAWLAIYVPWFLIFVTAAAYFGWLVMFFDGWAGPFFYPTIVAFVLSILSGIPIARHTRGVIRGLRGLIEGADRSSLTESANYRVCSDHILVVRGVYDEATTALGIGALTASLSRWTSRMLPKWALYSVVYQLIVTIFVVIKGSVARDADPTGFHSWPGDDPVTFVVAVVGAAVALSFILFLLKTTTALGRLGFGREMFFASETYEVEVSHVPDSFESLTVVTLEPSFVHKGLRHGLYSHPQFHTTVKQWFVGRKPAGGYFKWEAIKSGLQPTKDQPSSPQSPAEP